MKKILNKVLTGNILKNLYYYFFLFLRKTKILLHNKLEKRIEPENNVIDEEFKSYLWQHLKKGLIEENNNIFFNTNVTNQNTPMLLSQARIILILCNNSEAKIDSFEVKELVRKMTNYLISMRSENSLFTFNQVSWDHQDEGIASTWAALALIKAYELTNEKKYLETAVETFDAMLKFLYRKETSLVHTKADNFWCLNAASTFAFACSLLLKHHYNKHIAEAMNDSIDLCINKIAEDGHYPYNFLRQGTYLLLYHPIVILTLDFCKKSEYLKTEIREKLQITNSKATDFLKGHIRFNKNRIFEPEIIHYSQYIISNITSLLSLKGKMEKELENSLLQNLYRYLKNNTLYLCMDKNNKLYDSDLYSVKDVLTIEVLYWYDIYTKGD
ncbi:MAG: hypothetical protein IPH62_08230 [Ignavibacteriae bacterium]|nr:hypothetical protein [Ignavibacteriota bacterium]